MLDEALRRAGRRALPAQRTCACPTGLGECMAMPRVAPAGARGAARRTRSESAADAAGCRCNGRWPGAAGTTGRSPGRARRRLGRCREVPSAARDARVRIIAITCLPWPRFRAAHARLHPRVRRFLRAHDNDVKSLPENSSGAGFAIRNPRRTCEIPCRSPRNGAASMVCADARNAGGAAQMRTWRSYAAAHKIGLIRRIGAT